MSSLVVGSVALDTVETPFGARKDALGGCAVYFSIAASLFGRVSIVAVVGEDFSQEHIDLLADRGCDLEGLQRVPGRTFRWTGRYDENMNVAHTLDTQLNVFESFHPKLPDSYTRISSVFLGNIDPELQLFVLDQVASPRVIALDTMNFWIERKRIALDAVMRRVDIVIINEDEARQFSGVHKIAEAARYIREFGPETIVIKRGEYGCAMFNSHGYFAIPAFPTETVLDTTGAGDSFAGGFIGYLDSAALIDAATLRNAVAYGTVTASFAVEDFSVEGIRRPSMSDIHTRFEALRAISSLDPVPAVLIAE